MRILLLLSLLPACFSPDPSKYNVICDIHHPECPEGQVCNMAAGRCEPPSPDQPDASSGPTDGVLPTGLRFGPTPACQRGMGWTHPDFPKFAACPGVFTAALASAQCKGGFRLCTQAPPPAFSQTLREVRGFFAGAQPAAQSSPWPPDSTLRCTWDGSTSTSPRGISGVGQRPGTHSAQLVQCSGFPTVQPCDVDGWTCEGLTDSQFLNFANQNPEDGVVCCK